MTTLQEKNASAHEIADWIESLPYVAKTLRLPDLHMKPGMEAPSSLVVASENVIVPHLVSESINDGMGLIATALDVEDLSPTGAAGILRWMNEAGAPSKATPSRYSWSSELLEAACRQGATPLLDHYRLDPSFVDAIEDAGRSETRDLTFDEFTSVVPGFLRRTRLTRSEIGLNFAGNHFLEVQAVDDVVDPATAQAWGLRPNQVVVMYHLGPGPLGSILSNLYAFRAKPQLHRKVGYAFFRNILHFRRGRGHHRTFSAFNRWLTLDPDSEQGKAYALALNVINNYGFAYRTASMAAVVDAVQEVAGADRDSNRLIVDMSHNMLGPETIDGNNYWVSRHNCCRPAPGFPGIVAGSHQVPSCLTIGPEGTDSKLSGYDHGVGFLIEQAQTNGGILNDPRGHQIRRLSMTRGTQQLHDEKVLPLLERSPLDDAMSILSAEGMTRPVAYLRPLATLKHKT